MKHYNHMELGTTSHHNGVMNRRNALGLFITAIGGALTSCGVGGAGQYSSYENPVGQQGPCAAWLSSTRYLDSIGANAIEISYRGVYSKRQELDIDFNKPERKGKVGTANFSATVVLWSLGPPPGANVVQDNRSIHAAVKDVRLNGNIVATRSISRSHGAEIAPLKMARDSGRDARFDDWLVSGLPSGINLIAAYSPSRKAAMLYNASWYVTNPVLRGTIPYIKNPVGSGGIYDGASLSGAGTRRNPLTGSTESTSKYVFSSQGDSGEHYEAILMETIPLRVFSSSYKSKSMGDSKESLEYSLVAVRKLS